MTKARELIEQALGSPITEAKGDARNIQKLANQLQQALSRADGKDTKLAEAKQVDRHIRLTLPLDAAKWLKKVEQAEKESK